jgi:hypothetical protein
MTRPSRQMGKMHLDVVQISGSYVQQEVVMCCAPYAVFAILF